MTRLSMRRTSMQDNDMNILKITVFRYINNRSRERNTKREKMDPDFIDSICRNANNGSNPSNPYNPDNLVEISRNQVAAMHRFLVAEVAPFAPNLIVESQLRNLLNRQDSLIYGLFCNFVPSPVQYSAVPLKFPEVLPKIPKFTETKGAFWKHKGTRQKKGISRFLPEFDQNRGNKRGRKHYRHGTVLGSF